MAPCHGAPERPVIGPALSLARPSVRPRRPPPQGAAGLSKAASWHPEAESAWRGPGVSGDRSSYEPQPRAVRPGIGPERITPVQLVEPAAGGQGHRAENGPPLTVFAVVLDCLAVVALPALCDEVDGLLDVVTVFTRGCVNPGRPAVGGRPRPVLDRLPAVEKGPRPGLANAERWLRHRGRRRTHGTRHEARSEIHFASPVLSQDRGRSCHSLHISSKPTAFGTSPRCAPSVYGRCGSAVRARNSISGGVAVARGWALRVLAHRLRDRAE